MPAKSKKEIRFQRFNPGKNPGTWIADEAFPLEETQRKNVMRGWGPKISIYLQREVTAPKGAKLETRDLLKVIPFEFPKSATHAVCVRLNSTEYFILGGWKPTGEPTTTTQIRAKLIRFGFPVSPVRLVTFRIETPEQKATLMKLHKRVVLGKGAIKACIPEMVLECQKGLPKNLQPNQLWKVDYECRPDVIRISPLGCGFFAPGQEPCWGFSAIATWVKQI